MSRPNGLIPGTLDLLILKLLDPQPMHGWSVARQLSAASRGRAASHRILALYWLHRLERSGLIAGEWKFNANNRRVVRRRHHVVAAAATA